MFVSKYITEIEAEEMLQQQLYFSAKSVLYKIDWKTNLGQSYNLTCPFFFGKIF